MKIQLLLLPLLISSPLAAQSLDEPDVPTALYERKGGYIVNAPLADFALAQTYHKFSNKGTVHDGLRITLMTAKGQYKIGEEVRVLHILESISSGKEVYTSGPKEVTDEYVDGQLVTIKGPLSWLYRGPRIDRPLADFNYNISTYTFKTAGVHTIQWNGYGGLGETGRQLQSNVITLRVTE